MIKLNLHVVEHFKLLTNERTFLFEEEETLWAKQTNSTAGVELISFGATQRDQCLEEEERNQSTEANVNNVHVSSQTL